jgi:hypothetical protein
MAIEFRCPECGRLLQAGGDTVGRRVLCPGCAAFCMVPGPAAGRDVPPMPAGPAEPEELPPPAIESGSPFGLRPISPADAENPYLTPTQYGPAPPAETNGAPVARTDGRAVAALILGVVGLCMSCMCLPPLGIPVGGIGLMLGIMARRSPGRGMAIAGIVLCSIQLALALAYVAMIVIMVLANAM